jgi:hypothetical protein
MTALSGEITEYLTSNGLELIPFHGINQAWGYRENEPVFAVISDPEDGSMVFQNALSLYWATAEYISRPWCLFMMTGAPMMPHHRQMLENLAVEYNVVILESPTQDELQGYVEAQLTSLTSIMHRYIESGAEKRSVSLGESIREWKEQKPVLEEVSKVEVKVGDLTQYELDGRIVPSRTTVPLTIQSGVSSIEGILPRLIQSEPLVFYTEHRNLPIVFNLGLGESTFTTRFEADKGNLVEASNYESLMTAFKSTGEISFTDQNTGKTVFDLSVIG